MVGTAEHSLGDKRCAECWNGYPKLCQCQGLIHAQFIKEEWEGEIKFIFSCDNCGSDFKYFAKKRKDNTRARKKPKWKRAR